MKSTWAIYWTRKVAAWLTTDSAAARDGVPVLRYVAIGEKPVDYGRAAVLPTGETAAEFVARAVRVTKGPRYEMAKAFLGA